MHVYLWALLAWIKKKRELSKILPDKKAMTPRSFLKKFLLGYPRGGSVDRVEDSFDIQHMSMSMIVLVAYVPGGEV